MCRAVAGTDADAKTERKQRGRNDTKEGLSKEGWRCGSTEGEGEGDDTRKKGLSSTCGRQLQQSRPGMFGWLEHGGSASRVGIKGAGLTGQQGSSRGTRGPGGAPFGPVDTLLGL